MSTALIISGERFAEDSAERRAALAKAHQAKTRPLCTCVQEGVEMYIALVGGKHLVKRMPNTGGDHAPGCDHYEPPAELSGLGQVMGTAIQEDPEDGTTALKLDFSLTKVSGKTAPVAGGAESDSVKTDGTKLSLRGTLHYLWEEAGFNRWSPGMAGRRSWFVIRKYLLQAAEAKTAKGSNLGELLYIPEQFSIEKKDEIAQRRMALLARASTATKGARRLMIVIGEVKAIEETNYGARLVFWHAADCPFMMNSDLHKRFVKRFADEITLAQSHPDSHLMAIATFSVGSTGVAAIEEIAVMNATAQWVPFENNFDLLLIQRMCAADRRFVVGLRYNLSSSKPLACMVASDTYPTPTAMYIEPPGAAEEFSAAMQALIAESRLQAWIWRPEDPELPDLPADAPVQVTA